MSDVITTASNTDLAAIAALLQQQRAQRLDVVAPAAAIRAEGGRLVVRDAGEPVLSLDGVTTRDAALTPNAVADAEIADKLGIPTPYVRRLREDHAELWDANVNGWLQRDERSFLVRGLTDGSEGDGIARAFLSDQYRIVDNLDVLLATLEGLRSTGIDANVTGADLSEKRMYVRVSSPAVAAAAPQLLADYRSPFTGDRGADNPLVFAGFVITNSEVGHGAFTITPRLEIQVCQNGMTMQRDALRSPHLGGRMDHGQIRFSDATQRKNLELVKSQTVDAVRTLLDADYLAKVIAEMTDKAATEVTAPSDTVERVKTELRYTDAQRDEILSHFLKGGDPTAGGVMHAVTSAAQVIRDRDADKAHEMETHAVRALEIAAAAH
ncbi:DUF932 domain-containing protein (plasmid) [Amycolatopsis sp. AA4]|uniref:hypothetical protein n=1 Tax=Actinomycetes TaxID=1760 RepID=UPI0001B57BC7|nr:MULTISPECIES: hypothetical protein [Actinomycetes]ATY17293.1 DUF932 domain-containing protein [Amycolatopsis sp. AA4]EFL12726.1 conserved hypothetical protein [Streptomyces sp. AA4]